MVSALDVQDQRGIARRLKESSRFLCFCFAFFHLLLSPSVFFSNFLSLFRSWRRREPQRLAGDADRLPLILKILVRVPWSPA